ncbi:MULTISPECIES: hypothetical protein [Cyanophyceae]|uniref:hypothetical protein n=1 Tax=Cyanophyceae TaxID=3028117 RepID=UPI00168284C1|nr:hypothetical protein [Trichocoleus sp. FACHB-69]MBD1934990.1 hypothetical protein [Trichocoleus sp. FACHB-69]
MTQEAQQAIDYYLERLSACRQTQDRQEELACLSHLAETYAGLFQFSQAIDYHKQVLTLTA